jgi:hypothetical protein
MEGGGAAGNSAHAAVGVAICSGVGRRDGVHRLLPCPVRPSKVTALGTGAFGMRAGQEGESSGLAGQDD